MADHKNLKRLIRARMRKTGESYTAARAQVLKAGQVPGAESPPASALNAPLEPAPRGPMYPFERFTERAQKVLTLAQEEAESSHHSYIGTEHLLLGLLREGTGAAAQVLGALGIDIDAVRSTIDRVIGRNERILIQQIIPTSRVKKVIEISFEEARRMGNNNVGTEHLLLALLIEGEGIAAHVLEDLGADLDAVRDTLAQVGAEPEAARAPGRSAARAPAGPATTLLPSIRERALGLLPQGHVDREEAVVVITTAVFDILAERRWPMPRNERARLISVAIEDILGPRASA